MAKVKQVRGKKRAKKNNRKRCSTCSFNFQ